MHYILDIVKSLLRVENYTLRNFSYALIVLMCIQYIPIESRAGVSPVKVAAMGISIILLLTHLRFNRALLIGFLYMLWMYFTAALLHPLSFRASTVIYSGMFITTYIAFYTFVNDYEVISLDGFIRFIRGFIYVLVGVLVLQQMCIVVGLKYLPIINLSQILDRGIGANSLTYEPSTLARVLLVLYYAYIKCNEYKEGEKVTITQIFSEPHKWVTISFLWAMLTMGSSTAFICLGILSLYFLHGWYILISLPIFVAVYYSLSFFEVSQFERARAVAIATSTGDSDLVMDTDGSAAARIKPVLNTLSIDLNDIDIWVGRGCDAGLSEGIYGDNRYLGEISDYGFIAYLLSLTLTFACAIKFKSLATVFYFCGVGGGTGNISYLWGLLMIFTVLRYLSKTEE